MIFERVFHTGREVSEVVLAYWIMVIPIIELAFAFQDKIKFLLTFVAYRLALSSLIQSGFPKTGDASHNSVFAVPLAKNRLVVAGFRREVGVRDNDIGN